MYLKDCSRNIAKPRYVMERKNKTHPVTTKVNNHFHVLKPLNSHQMGWVDFFSVYST